MTARILTTKSNREVVLEPLDGSGRRYVLLGQAAEDGGFVVGAPTRRSVSQALISQQRRTQARRYSIEVALFEPVTHDDGASFSRPDSSAIYEQSSGRLQLTAAEQIEMVREIAQLHEQGILLRYSGIAVELPRCSITSFNARTVYATGRGTLTIEERPEVPLGLEQVAISFEAAERALQELREAGAPAKDLGRAIDFLRSDDLEPLGFQMMLRTFLVETLGVPASFPVFMPLTSAGPLQAFGLECLPVKVGDSQILPADATKKIPRVGVIDLSVPLRNLSVNLPTGGQAQNVLAVPILGLPLLSTFIAPQFAFVTFYAGLFIRFSFKMGLDWSWTVKAEVFPNAVSPPIIDDREPTEVQARPDCPEVPAVPTQRGPNEPYVVEAKVAYGSEVAIANLLTFTFVGPHGINPFASRSIGTPAIPIGIVTIPAGTISLTEPRGTEIRSFGLVLADYR